MGAGFSHIKFIYQANSILHFNRKWSGAVHLLCPFPRKLFLKLCMQSFKFDQSSLGCQKLCKKKVSHRKAEKLTKLCNRLNPTKICISVTNRSSTMADFSTPLDDYEMIEAAEIQNYVEQNGVKGISGFLKEKLDTWKKTEVHLGITGDSGTGKSSFVNAIRG